LRFGSEAQLAQTRYFRCFGGAFFSQFRFDGCVKRGGFRFPDAEVALGFCYHYFLATAQDMAGQDGPAMCYAYRLGGFQIDGF